MAGLMDDMRQKLIRQAKERAAASARESTTLDASESTSAHTSDPTAMYTHTSSHTSASTQNTTYTHTQTPEHTPDDAPTPRINMKRTQIYLRPDQIAWLDKKAEQSGKGVTRSDWVRYAVDELMRRDVDV